MTKYRVGDVAALFPDPPKPKTESGKKIQSLFEEFYNKPTNHSKKWKAPKQSEGKKQPVKDVSEGSEAMTEGKPRKTAKRKSQKCDTTQVKKPKWEKSQEPAPFPRQKMKKGRRLEGESYLPRKKEMLSEMELFSSELETKETDSQDESGVPEREEVLEMPARCRRSKKKRKALEKLAKNASDTQDEEDVNGFSPNKEVFPRSKSRFLKEKSTPGSQDDGDVDFQKPGKTKKPEKPTSKIIFQMKGCRVAPSGGGDAAPSANPKKKLVKGVGEESEERLSRTLFVGNLPLSTTRKSLVKLFSPFGTLDSCRLRGAVPTKASIPKKIADIKRKYHSGLHSRIGYVVLKERKAAIEAMSLSGLLIDGHHIVVDQASGEKKLYDQKRSVFVGNLPFDIKDESLWTAFLPCGDIEAVRVIRDKETGAGKGFGYVSFQKFQGKEAALSLQQLEVCGRQLRIKGVEGGRQQQLPRTNVMRRLAKKQRSKGDGNPNSRKTLKKLMNRGKKQHQKKKIAHIFKNFV